MLDERTKKNIETLLPQVRENFTKFMLAAQAEAAKQGLQYVAINGCRTWDEQEKLYAQGRTSPGKIVTNARPGYSYHNFGLAIDCGVFKNGKYLDGSKDKNDVKRAQDFHSYIASTSIKFNLRWGGVFKIVDMPHYEYNTLTALNQLRAMHASGLTYIV